MPLDFARHVAHLLTLLTFLFCSACAPLAEEHQRYFWPPGIEDPRIEYINYFWSENDAKRGAENWVSDAVFGKEKPTRAFEQPRAIASNGAGKVFVSDVLLHKVYVFDLIRHEVRALEGKDGGVQSFASPMGLALDDAGQIYVTDAVLRKVFVFGQDERLVTSFGQDHLVRPTGVTTDSERRRLYVADTGAHQVSIYDLEGTLLNVLGGRGQSEGLFNFPLGIDVDRQGNLYILDSMNARIQVFDPDGNFLRTFGERGTALGSFQLAKDLSVSSAGHVYVTDSQAHRFVIFDLQGNFLLSVGGRDPVVGGGIAPGGFYLPTGIDVDAQGAIWVVDSLNRMFHQFQYLNEDYLEKHPILPGQIYLPPGFHRSRTGSP